MASPAHGDPSPPTAPLPPGGGFWHVGSKWHLTTDGGSRADMPPAYVLDEPTWVKLDSEVRRLQTVETRLTAENDSYRKSAAAWRPSWWIIAGAVATGIATGWYVHSKI